MIEGCIALPDMDCGPRLALHLQLGRFQSNVHVSLVSDWERGVKRPGGPALRLLTVIEKKGIQAIA